MEGQGRSVSGGSGRRARAAHFIAVGGVGRGRRHAETTAIGQVPRTSSATTGGAVLLLTSLLVAESAWRVSGGVGVTAAGLLLIA